MMSFMQGFHYELNLASTYSPSFFKALFDLGLDVDFKFHDCGNDYTLLIQAVAVQNNDLVKFLVNQGANLNTIVGLSFVGEAYTALKVAVEIDNLELTRFLLEHGASKKVKYIEEGCDHYGLPPDISIYKYVKSQEMKNLLKHCPSMKCILF